MEYASRSPERSSIDLPREMGFQSYELFAGDAEYRKQQEQAFLSGEVRNPHLDYPLLDNLSLDQGITRLYDYLESTRVIEDQEVGDIAWDSASYRIAEMYWIKEAARLNHLYTTRPYSDDYRQSAVRFQSVNEELYGKPEPETAECVYGEILAQAHEKQLDSTAQQIYDEFVQGVTVRVGNEDVIVPGIGSKSQSKRLPEVSRERLDDLREFLTEQFKPIINLVNTYWNEECRVDNKGNRVFETHDMKQLFERVHALYDPKNESGISVVTHSGASLAWDTPSMSVRIGERRKAITSPIDMVAKIIHEYGVHGLRAVNGLKTDAPMLGTGVFTEADNDTSRADYLTFEEGFASTSEMAINGSSGSWKPLHISHYLMLMSAYEGADFRQAYERGWRARVLMSVKSSEVLDQKMIDREKKQAYLSAVRVHRGTPTNRTGGPIVTFNKDLAYLNGKLDTLRYIDDRGDEPDAYSRLFAGKFDPNNPRQDAVARSYATTQPLFYE